VIIGDYAGSEVYDNTVDRVTVVDSGYGSSGLGRADEMWILAICRNCRATRNRIVNCTVENGADDGIEVWSMAGGVDNYPLMTPYTCEQRIYLPVLLRTK
jgi:hypothetical protein